MTIRELEELIKAAPNKDLEVHILCYEVGFKCTVSEAKLEDKALVLVEKDDEVEETESEDEENE